MTGAERVRRFRLRHRKPVTNPVTEAGAVDYRKLEARIRELEAALALKRHTRKSDI
jgi:hypothetical protein